MGDMLKFKPSFLSLPATLFAYSVAASSTGFAQSVVAERQLSLTMAAEAASAAIEKCRADGFRVTVVVVDRAGQTKVVMRDDTTSPHTLDTATKKAFTTIAFRITSAEFSRRVEANPGLRAIEGTITLGGGLPIRLGTEVIAGIGVGGAPSGDADAACAQAGIDKIAGRL